MASETVADIANEMRGEWAQVYFSEGSRRKDGEYCDNEFAAIEPGTVADRIEAAHKREVDELRYLLNEVVGCAEEFLNFIDNHPYLPKYLRDLIAKNRKAQEGAAK